MRPRPAGRRRRGRRPHAEKHMGDSDSFQRSSADGRGGTAYERGVAHLKRGEHPQAAAAFTEAIGGDPQSPNAYVGRALAYRSLGDEAAAARDEAAAKDLGGPERSAWDRVVN